MRNPRASFCTWFTFGLAVFAVAVPAAFGQPPPVPDPEQVYQRFLTVYSNSSSRQELLAVKDDLEAAQRAVPEVYKFRFGLGAVSYVLGQYADALAWFDRALEAATTEAERASIEILKENCRTELIKADVSRSAATIESVSLQVSFIMKGGGGIEMQRDLSERLPQRLQRAEGAPAEALGAQLRSLGVPSSTPAGGLLLAGWEPEARLEEHHERFKDHLAYLTRRYELDAPRDPVVVVLSERVEQLLDATRRIYPDVSLPAYAPFLGYFNPADNLIMATAGRAGYGTLLHEAMHAFVHADYPDAPPWLDEGLASLYERTKWVGARLEPLPNWRMDLLSESSVRRLDEIVALADRPDLSARDIAELRLLFLYVESAGGMDRLYRNVRGGSSLAATAASLGLAEPQWRAFVADTFKAYRAELALDRGALSNPDEVRFVQAALNRSLGAELAVDGLWGSTTQAAIVEFQRKFGLAPDGLVGPGTMRELRKQFALATLD